MTLSSSPSVPASQIAARLRAAREASGLSIELAADRLHCDTRLLTALEAGQFDELGARVFVRGHIRRYADLVGENGLELVELWSSQSGGDVGQVPDLTRIAQARRHSDPRQLRKAAIAAGVALLLAVIAWLILGGSLGS